MKLTRRDAVTAIGATGLTVGGALGLSDTPSLDDGGDDVAPEERDLAVLLAVAETVYPDEVETTAGFVETHLRRRSDDRTGGIVSTTRRLDRWTRQRNGTTFAALPASRRDSVLRRLGVARAGSDPDGTLAERTRYYLVNELLYALFTSPKGSSLVGIDNPIGYPGGYGSYQEPPGNE